MYLKKLILFTSALLLLSFSLRAQNGIIRGTVTDGESGDALLGATVVVYQDGQQKGGAYTDLEGKYNLKLPAGSYQIQTRFISYVTDTSEVVTLADGETKVMDVLMLPETSANEDFAVEIVARKNQASNVTLFNKKRNAIQTMDGVTSELFQRIGANDAAAAVAQVTGVTVEGGKYVYVRGLGDRYSKTILNGAEIPGLDPNRNTVQMDLFPANLIDNIIVYKTFTPDLPGSFTGGLVDVKTKDFPDKFTVNVSASAGYNPNANLNDEFIGDEQGSTDWLGIDDGGRDRPFPVNEDGKLVSIPDFDTDNEVKREISRISRSFDSNNWAPQTMSSGLNQSYRISVGNQFLFGEKNRAFGFIASLSYNNSFQYRENQIENRWRNTSNAAIGNIANSLNAEINLAGPSAQQEVLWGGLVKLSFKPSESHKISFNFMRNQSGTNTGRFLSGGIPKDDPAITFETSVVGFRERAINVSQLQGEHAFAEGKFKADWSASYTTSLQNEPDLRFFSNSLEIDEDGELIYDLDISIYPEPNRFWREMDETNGDFKLNFEIPFKLNENDSKIKFGGAYTFKDRNFNENRYNISIGTAAADFEGDVVSYFDPSNVGVIDSVTFGQFTRLDMGLFYQDASEARNRYTGEQNITAAYLMGVLGLTNRLKATVGARLESTFIQTIAGNDSTGTIEENDILPAISLVYALNDQMNLRGGFSRTLARPTFREFAPFASFDFVNDALLVGNPNLERTLIDNADLRWEWYPTFNELVSFSLFYKNFSNPIERVLDLRSQNPQFEFRNVDNGVAYGLELEVRKNFSFISENLRKLEVGGNIALINSRIDIAQQELEGLLAIDPTRDSRRPMFGQSPYSINAEIAFVDPEETGIKASLNYNIFGERIAVVGGTDPNIFEQPRGLMNFTLSKTFKQFTVTFRARNILDPDFLFTQEYNPEGSNNDPFIFRKYNLGRTFSLGVSFKL
ncbi:MAG: TonB-dependent receptor [Bacteroidota bacterium]